MKTLSSRQKAVLCQLARKAFDYVARRARARGETFDDSPAALGTWRRAEVLAACGCNGLSQATNAQYNIIAARFESLLGNDDRALNHHLRSASEGRRQAEAVIVREMQRGGFGPEYVQTICRAQFKCAVEDASAEQLRKLIMTVKARAAAKRRRHTAASAPDLCAAPAGTT